MVTRKKLNRQRLEGVKDRIESRLIEDPTQRPRWRKHEKDMEIMLNGVDPDRFEALADERTNAS